MAFAAIELLALRYPRWGAALIVLAVLVVVALLLALVGYFRVKRLETPAGTVRRRLTEHNQWWSERFGPVKRASSQTDEHKG